jgi:hypothetical protein
LISSSSINSNAQILKLADLPEKLTGLLAMKKVWPHEFFRLDFDQMLEEGRRQEEIHTANRGEYITVQNMHAYFDGEVLPLILSNDWVFDAATRFATDYAIDCLHFLKLSGREAYDTQKHLLEINRRVVDILSRAYHAGAAPQAGTVDLPKASDFLNLMELDNVTPEMRSEAVALYEEVTDHEILQLKVTLRGIRASYETSLPRVMYVVRRAIKVKLGLPRKASDSELTGISDYISWYTARVNNGHPLYPVLGELPTFYKVARNVASHHRGLEWRPESNEIILTDESVVLAMPLHEFQQKYRHMIYLCELGLRGILSAFCERERGPVSNWLVNEYAKTFPEDFPESEPGVVRFYPT